MKGCVKLIMQNLGKFFCGKESVSKMYEEAINSIRRNIKSLPENEPIPENIIVEAANTLLDAGSLKSAPVQIINLCRNMGFSVYMQELPHTVYGYIMISGDLKERFNTDRIISVNEAESAKRRRFTVAHELGHFLFNFDPSRSIEFYNAFETSGENSPDEDVCNRFAAELLMPQELVTVAYRKAEADYKEATDAYYNIVQRLSEEFLVPPKAVERRISIELRLTEG